MQLLEYYLDLSYILLFILFKFPVSKFDKSLPYLLFIIHDSEGTDSRIGHRSMVSNPTKSFNSSLYLDVVHLSPSFLIISKCLSTITCLAISSSSIFLSIPPSPKASTASAALRRHSGIPSSAIWSKE